jgi:hypothetical protein
VKSGENAPSTTTSPPRRRRRRRLGNLRDVRTALAEVVRKLEANDSDGKLDSKTANAMTYALHTLAGVIHGADFEDRLAAIEKALAGAGDRTDRRVTQ